MFVIKIVRVISYIFRNLEPKPEPIICFYTRPEPEFILHFSSSPCLCLSTVNVSTVSETSTLPFFVASMTKHRVFAITSQFPIVALNEIWQNANAKYDLNNCNLVSPKTLSRTYYVIMLTCRNNVV